ncbi:hypothetical protein D3C76_1663030 [compost metagenome]
MHPIIVVVYLSIHIIFILRNEVILLIEFIQRGKCSPGRPFKYASKAWYLNNVNRFAG